MTMAANISCPNPTSSAGITMAVGRWSCPCVIVRLCCARRHQTFSSRSNSPFSKPGASQTLQSLLVRSGCVTDASPTSVVRSRRSAVKAERNLNPVV
jgi:hypothetical protein